MGLGGQASKGGRAISVAACRATRCGGAGSLRETGPSRETGWAAREARWLLLQLKFPFLAEISGKGLRTVFRT